MPEGTASVSAVEVSSRRREMVLRMRNYNQEKTMTAGTKLNDTYTLIEEIGSGGGGVVYRAYHERLHTDVVVKKIRENVKGILESGQKLIS